jgi:hypothetical protein
VGTAAVSRAASKLTSRPLKPDIVRRLAHVAGTQEPVYGPDAIQSVTKQADETPYTELRKEDLKWTAMDSTCVETQTFYMHSDKGRLGLAQVIYSNVA